MSDIEMLTKKFQTMEGRIIFSIILGIGLAGLFRKSCENRNCLKFMAPPIDKVRQRTYKHGDSCYKFEERSVKCDPSKEQVQM